jgi:uncharacterized protein YuzE
MESAGRLPAQRLLRRQAQEGNTAVALKAKTENVQVWFDPEGDFLEVLFEDKVGYFKETGDDRVMVRVDIDGRIIGFNILTVSSMKEPTSISLEPTPDEDER